MLIAGGILLSAYLLGRNKKRIALIPVFAAAIALLSLGGRGTAIAPLLSGVLLLWYRSRELKGWPAISFKLSHVFAFLASVLLGTWFFYFGALYRGGYGLSALVLSLSPEGIWEYAQYTMFAEFGHLHGLAGAIAIGPGVLEGKTFFSNLSWPLSMFLPIPGRSPGIFIVETLMGFANEHRWGLHASLIGDTYLNFGMWGILLIMPLFGILSKLLYAKFRAGTLSAAFYAFVAVYGVNLFLKSIDAWQNILTGLVFMLVLVRLADVFYSSATRVDRNLQRNGLANAQVSNR
jgi:oligosaccharide repeat unit polymerase